MSTGSLEAHDWDRIWAFASRYTEAEREHFERSVRRKAHLCFATEGDELVGITAVDTASVPFEGRTVIRIYTANTLIAESHRGRNLIQRWGMGAFARARVRHPFTPIYWFLDTYSYRSYLLLSRNFREYWPRRDRPTPPEVSRLIHALASPLYGADWDEARGVVRADAKRLKGFVSPIDAAERDNPDIRFFEERNPRHAQGEMLVCLAPLDARNWAVIAARSLARALRRDRATARRAQL